MKTESTPSPPSTSNLVEMFGTETSIPVRLLQAELSSSSTKDRDDPSLPSILYSLILTVQQEEVPDKPISSKLRIPLANNAMVTSFALEKDAKWFPAVPISKKKAKEVVYLEKEKGRNVASVSNVAATNVFEIEVFPLEYNRAVRCKLEFIMPDRTTATMKGDELLSALGFSFPEDTNIVLHQEKQDIVVSKEMDSLPTPVCIDKPKVWVGTAFGERHFVCEMSLEAVKKEFDQNMRDGSPIIKRRKVSSQQMRRVGILWDVSASAATADIDDRCKKLRTLYDQIGPPCCFHLWSFDIHGMNDGKEYSDINELIAGIKSFHYDGGTDMTIIPKFIQASCTKMDAVLIFTDGVDSLNQLPHFSDLNASAVKNDLPPVYCIGDQKIVNMTVLRKLISINPHFPGRIFGQSDISYDVDALMDGFVEKYALERIKAIDQSDDAFFGMEDDGFCCIPDHRLLGKVGFSEYQLKKEGDSVQITGRIGETVTGLSLQFKVHGRDRYCDIHVPFEEDVARNANVSFVDFDMRKSESDCCQKLLGMMHAIAAYNETESNCRKMDLAKADLSIIFADLAIKYNFCTPEASLLLLYTAEQFEDNDILCPEFHPVYAEWASRSVATKKAAMLTEQKKSQQKEIQNSTNNSGINSQAINESRSRLVAGISVGNRKSLEAIQRLAQYINILKGNHKESRSGVLCSIRRSRSVVVASSAPAPPPPVQMYGGGKLAAMTQNRGGGKMLRPPEPSSDEEDDDDNNDGGMDIDDNDHFYSSCVPSSDFFNAARQASFERPNQPSNIPSVTLPSDPKEYESVFEKPLSARNNFDSILMTYQELRQNDQLKSSPSFFLNTARLLLAHKSATTNGQNKECQLKNLALKVVSNCLEMRIGDDPQMLRCVGYFLQSANEFEKAILVFDQVRELSPLEPQSFLDCSLSRMMMVTEEIKSGILVHPRLVEEAQNMIIHVLLNEWVSRFAEIEYPALVLLHWMERFITLSNARNERTTTPPCKLPSVWDRIQALSFEQPVLNQKSSTSVVLHSTNDDLRILINDVFTAEEVLKLRYKEFGVGLTVWMAWDTDHTDIDLHVHENVVGGEHVSYQNRHSQTGGYLSRDFTDGYGPEVYTIKKPLGGNYKIDAKYYGSHQASKLTGATSAILWILKDENVRKSKTDRGNDASNDLLDDITIDFKTVRLEAEKQLHHVHTVKFDT